MFVPGHSDRFLDRASRCEADVLLLDLEDSVQPQANKAVAREKIINRLREGQYEGFSVFPRINDPESGHLLEDIVSLAGERIQGFMYPKAHTGADIYFIDKLLESAEAAKGLRIGSLKLIPLIETTSALMHLQDICSVSKRVVAIAFGCEDYIADIGGVHDDEGLSIFTARSLIAAAARANDIAPIDTVHVRLHDLEDLERNLGLARKLGFEGALLIHPKEIPLANRYFSPSDGEVDEAIEMVRLFEEAVEEGKGVAMKGNNFIGPPLVLKAKKIIAKNERIRKKSRQ